MTRDEVIEYVTNELEGMLVVLASEENGAPEVAWGDAFFFTTPTVSQCRKSVSRMRRS